MSVSGGIYDETFLVAASRLGYLSKPVWCNDNKLLNISWFLQDKITSNNFQNAYNLFVDFELSRTIVANETIHYVGCESLSTVRYFILLYLLYLMLCGT
jgi:hypothetical protein